MKDEIVDPIREAVVLEGKVKQLEIELRDSKFKEVNRLIEKEIEPKIESLKERGVIEEELCRDMTYITEMIKVDSNGLVNKESALRNISDLGERIFYRLVNEVAEYIEEVKEDE